MDLLLADRASQEGYTLAAPRLTESGALIVEAVLAVPGVMDYPHGPTYVPPETLSDSVWLESLAHVPVIDDDRVLHAAGVTVDEMEAARVGHVESARWDDAQQAVIGTLRIDTRRGVDAVRAGVRGVSPAYRVRIIQRAGVDPVSGVRYTHVQDSRSAADNVALTMVPRGGAATRLRADSQMDELQKQIEALKAQIERLTADAEGDMLKAIADKVDAMGARIDAIEADMADYRKAADADDEPAPPTFAEVRDVLAAADAHGVEVGDDFDVTRKALAVKLLGEDAESITADALRVAIKLTPKREGALSSVRTTVSDSAPGAFSAYLGSTK